MIFHRNQTEQIDDLLNRIGEKLQLNKPMQCLVAEKYDEVYKVLEKNNDFKYSGNVYPQGSYALQTTVKPLGSDDFDLDVVIQFDEFWSSELSPTEVINSVVSGLADTYTDLKPKNRCVRINFKDFHLDVVPAFPYNKDNMEKIKVPNVETDNWKISCPKGYISWFEEKCRFKEIILEMSERFDITQEKLTEQVPYEIKPPLKIAVQLAKRFRDVYFENKQNKSTPSIIITTLFADSYDGSASAYETIDNILLKICDKIQKTKGIMEIRNPANNVEVISECWSDNLSNYMAFCEYIKEFAKRWEALSKASGIKETQTILESMFKENIASQVITEQAKFIADMREKDNLMISSKGTISKFGDGTVAIKKNNFFGE